MIPFEKANLSLEHNTVSLLFQNKFLYFPPHYKILNQLEQIGK